MDDEGFSGVVRLTNISDFITPSSNCIIPLETRQVESSEASVTVRKRANVANGDAPSSKKAVKVTLNDCLACNGCITSAETVLVEEQSLERLLEGAKGKKISVVTVSPQSVCSIAAKRNISPSEAARLISSYFLSKGITHVVDSSFGRILSLDESYREFASSSKRPIMASACPGFVCYAEKTHGKLLVSVLSRVRSPQAILGSLVKDYLPKKLGIEPSDVYHASVMMCFDKKLEASRSEFHVPGTEIRQTDCVVSTVEIDSVLDEVDSEITNSTEGWLGDFSRGSMIGGQGGASGGYAEYIMRRFIQEHGGEPKFSKLAKNLDQIEVINGDSVMIRVARVYGFRNIQNMVRKLKTNKLTCDYIEVMACPSGCANGGGQLRAETSEGRESLLVAVEERYNSLNGQSDAEMGLLKQDWQNLNGDIHHLLYTDFRSIETNIASTLQW